MPRRSKVQVAMDKYRELVRQKIASGDFIDATGIFDPIPPRERVREELEKPPIEILDRSFRVIKVEDLGDYKVFIQIPGEKKDNNYDFIVWRAIYSSNGGLEDLRIPTHVDLGKMYLELKRRSSVLNEYLLDSVIRFIRDRWPLNRVIENYFARRLEDELVNEVKKFLLTLKWIAIQEDANYPPPRNLGSIYALSVYAILEITGDLSALWRIIRFRG